MYHDVDFWIERTERVDEVLADRARISSLVKGAFRDDPNLVDLQNYPETLPGADVESRIRVISRRPADAVYFSDGEAVGTGDFARYEKNLNIEAIPDSVAVRFGLTLRRADMRTWPTLEFVFKTHDTFDLDRFQESGLFPAEPVAVLHESADGQWFFVQSYNYAAWVLKDKIVTGDREKIFKYRDTDAFLVVAGSKAKTNFNPKVPAISELQLDMGVRLPLLRDEDVDRHVDGQHPRSSHAVSLPVRGESDELQFRTALIARNQDVSVGYMPYTRRNILHQSFKFLGERYGWGHSYNARDCSGLVMEVYKTFGIPLPRNTKQQEDSRIGESSRIASNDSAEKKLEILNRADVGDLLYSPGHVMVYLGSVDGEAYVIHSLFGAGWTDDDGRFQEGVLNGVSVTPVRKIYASADATYFDQLTSLKRIR